LAKRKFRLARALSESGAAALVLASASFLYAQSSPLTVQHSTSRVGVNNTNPSYTLDVTGTLNATAKNWCAELFGTNCKK